jgi:hypothetical protein
MRVELVGFGAIQVEGTHYDHDIVIEDGAVRKRSKAASKKYSSLFGHTPLSIDEELPWGGRRLIIGTGAYAALPVMSEVTVEAERRGVELIMMPTEEACHLIAELDPADVNAVLHVTC